ncbi:MAG: LysR family transcriptional regulator [Pseudomonadota bacterium]
MKLPPLASLLPFEAAARLGSITKAGEELGLTQAAISRQIRALEDHLDTKMFERRNRAVHLTEEGRAFSQTLTRSLHDISNHVHELRQFQNGGEVLLRSQLCEGLYWLMPRLSEFYQKHPDIGVRVITSTRPLTETTQRFDLAIQTVGRDCTNAELVFSVSDDVFPVCSPKFLQAQVHTLTLAKLPECHLLHHSGSAPDWLDWDRWFERMGVDAENRCDGEIYDSYPLMMQAAIEGHGMALGWKRASERLLESGELVRPFQEQVSCPDSFGVYAPLNWKSKPQTAKVLSWIRQELS